MHWQDDEGVAGIADALLLRHPGVNPLGLRPGLIEQWTRALPSYAGPPPPFPPRLLERIQMAWHSRYLARPWAN